MAVNAPPQSNSHLDAARRIARDLLSCGVRPGGVLLVHASLRSMGRVPGGAETVLFERHLDPRHSVEDRGAQGLSLSFETQRGSELILRTGTGPLGDDGWDWSYWTELDIITEP